MSALSKAIFAKLAGTELQTSIGDRMCEWGTELVDTPTPFILVHCPSTLEVDRVFDQTRVEFSIYSKADAVIGDDLEVDVLTKQLLAVYRDCDLEYAGLNGNCGLESAKVARIPPDETGVRRTLVNFRIWVER